MVGAHTNLFRAINKIEMVPVICTRKYKKSEEYPWRTGQRINHPVQIVLRLVAVLSLLADSVMSILESSSGQSSGQGEDSTAPGHTIH